MLFTDFPGVTLERCFGYRTGTFINLYTLKRVVYSLGRV